MTPSLWRSRITAGLLGLASFLPATVGAQPPGYITQWGSLGSGDGQFNFPVGVATDAAGDVYVADAFNHRIQKFTGTGTYLTQWGSLGSGDGQFNTPSAVATDSAGHVYVVDQGNHRIQKFTGTGTYLTQWGGSGSGDGQFNSPFGVATDAAGDVYVTDTGNHRIQKFTGTGTYLTQWGSLGSGNGQFTDPIAVATDVAGDVYVADASNSRIQKFTGTGTYLTQWGSTGSGDGEFAYPISGVAADTDGNIYVVDQGNHRIQKFTGTGTYLTQWGSRGSGDGQFDTPFGVATDAAGDVYVADTFNHRIQKFGPLLNPHTITATAGPGGTIFPSGVVWVGDGGSQTFDITPNNDYVLADVVVDGVLHLGSVNSYTFALVTADHTIEATFVPALAQPPVYIAQWGSPGSGDGQFNQPQGVATDSAGNVFVADGYNSRIQKFTSTGTYITQWGSPGSGDGEFSYPWAVATDAAGNVYVADSQNNRIQKFTGTGTYITQWGGFYWPRGVATDAAGDVYVADTNNQRIQKFTSDGTFITQWGSFGSGNGQFYSPHAIATDDSGNVYVAEAEGPNQRVQKFTSTGTYLTQWGSPGSGDGQFSDPYGIGTDAAGNVYVADTRQHRVQKFTRNGYYLTQWGSGGSGNGQFIYPVGVATDRAGNIYVLDQGNSRIQKFASVSTPPITHTITATAGPGGTIFPSGAVQVNDGEDQTFNITPDFGYQVSTVIVDGSHQGAITSYTFSYVTADHTIEATFAPTTGTPPPVYVTQWGSLGGGDGQFNLPIGIARDFAGNLFVSDANNSRIQKFTSTGAYITQWGTPGTGDGQFSYPAGVATDSAGNVYVVDQNNHRVQKFTSTGTYITQWGTQGSFGDGRFYYPQGIATDRIGNVFVTDQACGLVQKFTGNGDHLTQWGGCGNGNGQFNGAAGVATDAAGYVYVVDQYNQRVQKFTNNGSYERQWGSFGGGDGQFNNPYGIALDASGKVYVSEWNSHRIQKFDSTGTYLTQWGSLGGGDGQFNQPFGVCTDPAGYIYIADGMNHRIQKFASVSTPPITHTITATAGPGGTIFPSGAVQVADGGSQAFNITPDFGYQVSTVIVDGSHQGAITSYTFSYVTADHTIEATFAELPPPPPPAPPVPLEANNIRMLVSTAGSFAWDLTSGAPGLEFPRGSGKTAVFASGLWLGALVNGSTRVTVTEYSDEFGPGAMVNGGPDDPNSPDYRVYRLDRQYTSTATRDSTLAAYNAGAVPHGAPAVSVLPSGDLDILGDQMLWHVYNDADPALHTNRAGHSEPLGVEVQQTAYAFDRSGALGNTVFLKFKILNKGSNLLEQLYAGLWSDPDLGGFTDDLVGSDPARSLGYCYNSTNNDAVYGAAPPAVGYDILRAEVGTTPTQGASSFIQYINGGDPQNPAQSYNFLRGLLVDGNPIIDPTTNQPTTYFYSGDPVAGTGWLDSNPSDRRFILPTGPFTLAPGESLEVVVAIVIGDGTDRLSSITRLRTFDDEVQQFFDSPECEFAMPFRFARRTLNLNSSGNSVNAFLDLPAPYLASQIDVGSIRVNGVVAVTDSKVKHQDRRLKVNLPFDELKLTLTPGDHVPVTITGMVADTCFTGADTIEVRIRKVHKPDHDSHLAAGTMTEVIWDSDPTVPTVSLLSSCDDGATWRVEVPSMPNTGSYLWTVSGTLTNPARLAVVTVFPPDETGEESESEFVISEAFTIVTPVGLGEGARAVFALRGVTPNPARDVVRIRFSLPNDAPATLALYDVSGRQLAERRVKGPGWQVVELGRRGELPAGLYIIRLTQGGRSLTSRAALVR